MSSQRNKRTWECGVDARSERERELMTPTELKSRVKECKIKKNIFLRVIRV